MRAIVPIANLQRRIPEQGRIRIGIKSGRAMKAIDTFRFTSHDQAALEEVAGLYGGTVRPWSDDKAADGQFEVITTASEIRVVLPPDPMGGTPIYEKWSGGGCERRCDGLTCTKLVAGPDGPEPIDVECLCQADGAMGCDPKTRLNVMLAGVRFGGTWRLESKSWNVAQEMPGMVELIQSLQESGLTRGVLALKHRRSVVAGQTNRFIIPVLGVDESLEGIAAGMAQMGALPSHTPPAGEIGSGNAPTGDGEDGGPADNAAAVSTSPDPVVEDDGIVDAELVDDAPTVDELKALISAAKVDVMPWLKSHGLPLPARMSEDQRRQAADLLANPDPVPPADAAPAPGESTPVDAPNDGADNAEATDRASTGAQPADAPDGIDPATGEMAVPISDHTRKKMFALAGEVWPNTRTLNAAANDEDRRRKLLGCAAMLGHGQLTSRSQITEQMAVEIVDILEVLKEGGQELHLKATGEWVLQAITGKPKARARKTAAPAAGEAA